MYFIPLGIPVWKQLIKLFIWRHILGVIYMPQPIVINSLVDSRFYKASLPVNTKWKFLYIKIFFVIEKFYEKWIKNDPRYQWSVVAILRADFTSYKMPKKNVFFAYLNESGILWLVVSD